VKLGVIAMDYDGSIMHDERAKPLAGRAIQVACTFGVVVMFLTEGP